MIEAELSPLIYEIAVKHGGSFSAEYGIGRFKRVLLDKYANGRKLALIKSLKMAIDPSFLMNRGIMLSG